MLDSVPSQHLPDICTSIVKASQAEKIQVLDAVDLGERFKKTLPLLMRQIEVSLSITLLLLYFLFKAYFMKLILLNSFVIYVRRWSIKIVVVIGKYKKSPFIGEWINGPL